MELSDHEPVYIMRDAIPEKFIEAMEKRLGAKLDFIVEFQGDWHLWCEGYPTYVAKIKKPELKQK